MLLPSPSIFYTVELQKDYHDLVFLALCTGEWMISCIINECANEHFVNALRKAGLPPLLYMDEWTPSSTEKRK